MEELRIKLRQEIYKILKTNFLLWDPIRTNQEDEYDYEASLIREYILHHRNIKDFQLKFKIYEVFSDFMYEDELEAWDGFSKLYSELLPIISQDYYKNMHHELKDIGNDDLEKEFNIRRRIDKYLNQINLLDIYPLEKFEYNRERDKLFDILIYKEISETELFDIIEYIFRFYKVKISKDEFLDITKEFLNEIEDVKNQGYFN